MVEKTPWTRFLEKLGVLILVFVVLVSGTYLYRSQSHQQQSPRIRELSETIDPPASRNKEPGDRVFTKTGTSTGPGLISLLLSFLSSVIALGAAVVGFYFGRRNSPVGKPAEVNSRLVHARINVYLDLGRKLEALLGIVMAVSHADHPKGPELIVELQKTLFSLEADIAATSAIWSGACLQEFRGFFDRVREFLSEAEEQRNDRLTDLPYLTKRVENQYETLQLEISRDIGARETLSTKDELASVKY